jgi:hypothetical protein
MPYIGPEPRSGRFAIVDQISGSFNGVNTDFRIRVAGANTDPGLPSNMIVFLNGIAQTPSGNLTYGTGFDFSTEGSILTFETPPAAGTSFYAEILGPVLGIGQPSDNTVVPGSITSVSGTNFIFPGGIAASGNIDAGEIDGTRISGSTSVFGTFVEGVSGEFQRLEVNTLDIDTIDIRSLTITGDLFVSGNYVSQAGDLNLTQGTMTSSGVVTTGLTTVTIDTQSVTSLEQVTSQTFMRAPTGLFTQTLSGNFIESATNVRAGQTVSAPTGIFTNISGDELHINELTVTGKLNITGINVSGFIGGNLTVSGLFAQSGFFEQTLSGNTITGNEINAVSGNFDILTADTFEPTTITAVTGIFTDMVSGVSGVFDNLNFNGNIESKSGIFTEFLSGLTITGEGLNVPFVTGHFFNTDQIQVEELRIQTFISGNPSDDPVTVTGSTGIEVTTSGVIIYGPVTILP